MFPTFWPSASPTPAAGLSSLCFCSVAPGGRAGLSIESTGAVVLPAVRWWLCGCPGSGVVSELGAAPGATGLAGGAPGGPNVCITVWGGGGGGDMGWGAPHLLGREGQGRCHCGCLHVRVSV